MIDIAGKKDTRCQMRKFWTTSSAYLLVHFWLFEARKRKSLNIQVAVCYFQIKYCHLITETFISRIRISTFSYSKLLCTIFRDQSPENQNGEPRLSLYDFIANEKNFLKREVAIVIVESSLPKQLCSMIAYCKLDDTRTLLGRFAHRSTCLGRNIVKVSEGIEI